MRHAARQGLGTLLEQGGGGASEQQKSGGSSRPVGEHPQRGEEIRASLDFVQDNEPPERFERQEWVSESRQIAVVLKIEAMCSAGPRFGDLLRERRLSDLPGAEQKRRRALAEETGHGPAMRLAGDHKHTS